VTLLARARSDFQLRQAEGNLKSLLRTLGVGVEVSRADDRGWIRASISGDDENAAVQYLSGEVGVCPVELEKVRRYSTFKGFLTGNVGSESELRVDVGVFVPEHVEASIPLRCLQAQLGDGKRLALCKLAELFGLREDVPLDVRITDVDFRGRRVMAELSDWQLRRFSGWTRSMLDRLLIVGASFSEVNSAVVKMGADRDVVEIERLGMFEHTVVCKVGTDAAGLIPTIGRRLGKAVFTVFSPRKIVSLLGLDSSVVTF
jgi:hypothetical protein